MNLGEEVEVVALAAHALLVQQVDDAQPPLLQGMRKRGGGERQRCQTGLDWTGQELHAGCTGPGAGLCEQ